MDLSNDELRLAVADLVRIHRRKQGLTQEKLAGAAGITFEHLNHVENDRSSPSIRVLDRLAKALGFERLSAFLGDDPRRRL